MPEKIKFTEYMNKILREAEEQEAEKEVEENEAKLTKTKEELVNIFSNADAPSDEDINTLSSTLGIKKDEIHKILYKLLGDWFGAGKYVEAVKAGNTPEIDDAQLQKGIEVEMEHTTSPIFAKKIALDHLTEMADYYTKLESMEGGE